MSLASAGALSMGQPVDHSIVAALFARRLSVHAGLDRVECDQAMVVALLRWSGCTSNAAGFVEVLGDDVAGRAALLTEGLGTFSRLQVEAFLRSGAELTSAHCEVATRLARRLHARPEVEAALDATFEQWNGKGFPMGIVGRDLPIVQRIVALATDAEVLVRTLGVAGARRRLLESAGGRNDPDLVECAVNALPDLAQELSETDPWLTISGESFEGGLEQATLEARDALAVLADFVDLKIPGTAGASHRVASTAERACSLLGRGDLAELIVGAALIHGLGKVSVPNSIWQAPRLLRRGEIEQIRLVPYQTERCLNRCNALIDRARIASLGFERLDGSGYYRELSGNQLDLPERILAASIAHEALVSTRPWRDRYDEEGARSILVDEAQAGRFDVDVVAALVNDEPRPPSATNTGPLTAREAEVLTQLASGNTNRAIAATLHISPKTVSRHLETIYRKLNVHTRAGATLAAVELQLL